MQLSPRAQEILAAIVREYILTGEAVGSRTLVRHQGISQSPATVRNVMSDLEEQGLLHQPHASAGRLPTDLGLRFFVDRLMKTRELTLAEQQEILSRYNLSNRELQELLREVSRLLSDLSRQCALVLVPRADAAKLKRIEFVTIRPHKMIAVLVLDSGQVLNRLLDVEPPAPQELESVHRYLNDLCVGLGLAEVRRRVEQALESEQHRYDSVAARALTLGIQALRAEPTTDEVLIEGQSKLLSSGRDPEQAKALLRAIEEKRLILRLLDETIRGEGVQVFIGAETKEEETKSCAVVARAFGGSDALGTLGVIGPASMDYPRVIPLVEFTADLLTRVLG